MSLSFFIDLALLIPLSIIGGICSYTDVKYGKIFNKWIKAGFLWGIFFYLSLFLYNSFFLTQPSNIQYLAKVFLNALISLVVGYVIWHIRLWSAGDAKFFALCAFLVPLKFYSKSYVAYFPSFNLLINLFVPLLLILALTALFTGIKELFRQKHKLKEFRRLSFKTTFPRVRELIKKFFLMFLDYIFIFVFFQKLSLLKNFIPGGELLFNPISLFFLMFVVYGFLSNLLKKKKGIGYLFRGMIVLYCFYLFFSGQTETATSLLRQTLIFMILITFSRQILNFYVEKKEVKKIKLKNLHEGVVLSKNEIPPIMKRLEKDKKADIFGKIGAEGLNEKQIRIIKNLFAGKPDLEMKTYKTFPFAPFMFLSVLISIFTNSSLLII